MPESPRMTIPVNQLRVGLYVHLDLGWMDHPFPLSSFKISSAQQIETIKGLGLTSIQISPDRSDPEPTTPVAPIAAPTKPAPSLADQARLEQAQARQATLAAQRQAQQLCERQCQESAKALRAVFDQVNTAPDQAGATCASTVSAMLGQLAGHEESALRLLAEGYGDRPTLHAMNVAVLSLLLGRAMGLDSDALHHLGMAALVHDIGKQELPDRVRYRDDSFTAAHYKLYQDHVTHSVAKAKQMGLPAPVLLTISQHHEMADGSGFPLGLKTDKWIPTARILALINRYEGLCNPPNPLKALTPHEALSLIFATMKERFEHQALNAFIRMMGVYPPGSIVQLTDERYAMVMSVNASRPLKPRVLVVDPSVPSEEAIFLDLQQASGLGIQRSLRAEQLPRQALSYLSPRQRVYYYFERAVSVNSASEGSA